MAENDRTEHDIFRQLVGFGLHHQHCLKDFQEYLDLSKLNRITGAIPTAKPQYSDGSLQLLSSNNKPYYEFKFTGLFPTSISSFNMNSSEGPDTILTADATFRYSYYDVKKLF